MTTLRDAVVRQCSSLVCLARVGAGRPRCPSAQGPALAFRIDEGHNLNSFLRDGPVAAHLLLRSGTEPRILVAFPAGNSGVGLWFEDTHAPVTWTLVAPPRPLTLPRCAKRRQLHGIEFEVETDAPRAASARRRAVVGARAARLRVAGARRPPK